MFMIAIACVVFYKDAHKMFDSIYEWLFGEF